VKRTKRERWQKKESNNLADSIRGGTRRRGGEKRVEKGKINQGKKSTEKKSGSTIEPVSKVKAQKNATKLPKKRNRQRLLGCPGVFKGLKVPGEGVERNKRELWGGGGMGSNGRRSGS